MRRIAKSLGPQASCLHLGPQASSLQGVGRMPAFPGFFKTPPQSFYFDSIVNFASCLVVLRGYWETCRSFSTILFSLVSLFDSVK